MLVNRPSMSYCLTSLKDRRIWVSASLSAILWSLPLIAAEGWPRIGENVPLGLLTGFAMLLAIALVMHLLFRERVQSLKGKQFWLFPFTSLTVAALLFSSGWTLKALADELRLGGIELSWTVAPIYWWVVSLIGVFFYLWITYPLAIVNQIIIRKIFGTSIG
jgi:hypothetical protein